MGYLIGLRDVGARWQRRRNVHYYALSLRTLPIEEYQQAKNSHGAYTADSIMTRSRADRQPLDFSRALTEL